MLDLQAQRKTKIILTDYDYQKDIANRLFLSKLPPPALIVLQEIVYSPVQFSLSQMAKELSLSSDELSSIIRQLEKTGLLRIAGDIAIVDKEARKSFETELLRFEKGARIGLDFLFGLLRKVPIHIHASWYSVPRSSNNIFDSVIERHFFTPHIYHRYLNEFYSNYPELELLIKDLFSSTQLKITVSEAMRRYHLTREKLEEVAVLLEFSFIACLRYENIQDEWRGTLTPFDEWKEYLLFLRETQPIPILEEEEIQRCHTNDFAFVHDLTTLLKTTQSKPIPITENALNHFTPTTKAATQFLKKLGIDTVATPLYFSRLIIKLRLLKLAEIIDGELCCAAFGVDFLALNDQDKALFLYRNHSNRLVSTDLSTLLPIDKIAREAEKNIQRILYAGWVPVKQFVESAIVALGDAPAIHLKKCGKSWKYVSPECSKEQKEVIELTLTSFLFETGMVSLGSYQNNPCIRLTEFGSAIFGH